MDTFLSYSGANEQTGSLVGAESTLNDSLSSIFASFGLDITNIQFLVTMFVWILIIIYVIKDSNYRSDKPLFVIFSLLLVTLGTPFIGFPIYLALRPLGYKYERAYRKAIMTSDFEEVEEVERVYNKTPLSSDSDDEHLQQLQEKITKAKERIQPTPSAKETMRMTPKKRKAPDTDFKN